MRSVVVVFPGSNCDRDARVALSHFTGAEPQMVWHKESELPATDLILLPGGFSYGDYLRAGAIAAQSPLMRDVIKKAGEGVAVLGICNGFQILTEMGLLPGALMRNRDIAFVCRSVWLRVESSAAPFSASYKKGSLHAMQVAHHEGNYQADEETLARLEGENRILFRYCDDEGGASPDANPNGSARNIAGVVNAEGNVLGLMPHPERSFDGLTGEKGGAPLFESLVQSLS